MTGVAEELVKAESEAGASVDVGAISAAVDAAWEMKLATSTREEIGSTTATLIKYLILLQGQPLGEDENPAALHMLRLAERHLSAANRPGRQTPTYEAFGYMRDSIVVLSSLLSLYKQTHERDS